MQIQHAPVADQVRLNRELVIRVPEVARRLDISRSKAYELVKRGQLPSLRVGATVRVPVAALEAWIQRQMQGAEAY